MPVERGDRFTNWMILRYSLALVAVTLFPFLLGIGGRLYLAVAGVLGAIFVWLAIGAFRSVGADVATRAIARMRWARQLFGFSIVYLVALFGTLVVAGH
ncbi:MAG: hypothetical protein NVS3B20_26450 [Polyangiales bacterium]